MIKLTASLGWRERLDIPDNFAFKSGAEVTAIQTLHE